MGHIRPVIYFYLILADAFTPAAGECSNICEWVTWFSWTECSETCGGGYRNRSRGFCCDARLTSDITECLDDCGMSRSFFDNGHTETSSCNEHCHNGGSLLPSGKGCQCFNRTFGYCCEEVLPGCTPLPTDVIFVLDSSVSETEEQFSAQLDFVKIFVANVNISEEEFKVAVVTFSTEAKVDINFEHASDKETLYRLIDEIEFRPGATFTNKGLRTAMEFARKSERRTGMVTLTYAFVLTDGMSSSRAETRTAAKELREFGVHVIAIGIGEQVSHQELVDIASPGDTFSPSYVFSVGDFNALDTLLRQLVQITCDDCSAISHLSDIVFLLDESNEITEAEFQLSLDVIGSLVENTDHIGEVDGPAIGLLQLGDTLNTIIELSDNQSQDALMTQLQVLSRRPDAVCEKDELCTGQNITSAIGDIFQSFYSLNKRQNSRKFLVVLSNGRFDHTELVKAEMAALHNVSNVKLFVIGPGLDVNMDGLLSLAKEANHVYVTVDNNDLSKLNVMQSEFSYNFCMKNK